MSARYKNTIKGIKKNKTHIFAVPVTKITETFATDAFTHILSHARAYTLTHSYTPAKLLCRILAR